MGRFIGRAAELAALEAAWQARGSALVPLYGRRRVGKSELLHRFLAGRRGIYFQGKRAPAGMQLREFLQVSATAVGEPLLASLAPEHWAAALAAAVARWPGPGKLVIALDEFQWMVEASPELPSMLQELWDRDWSRSGRVLLILCGSYLGFMEREVLGKKSPLFGRRTGQIHLQPFGYLEAGAFHPHYGAEERARAYFICGGIPLYLRAFDDDRSVEMNIRDGLLNEYAPLFREPDFLLREELRDVENYYGVMVAVAAGRSALREIARTSGVAERGLHYYLNQLKELGYVRRRYPLTGRPPSRLALRWQIADPLLAFWFRFVFPHTSAILHRGGEAALRELIRPELEAWFGSRFEALCREAMPRLYRREGVTAPAEIGEYWDPGVQIDVVGLREDGWTDLGECRWGTVRSAPAVEAELEQKIGRFPNDRGATIGRRVFVRRKPPAGARSAKWITLEELYREPPP